MSTRSEKVSFPGANGHVLAARLEQPAGPPRAVALFAHCFTCSKDVFAASRIARGLCDAGIAVLRFDFTGLGASEGEFANTNFSSNVGDLIAAADFLRGSGTGAPSLLVGHSLGGAAVLAAAARIPGVKAVATLNAPADPAHVEQLLTQAREEIISAGEAEVRIAGRVFRIKRQFLEDIAEQRLAPAIAGLGAALLVMHSPVDEIVSIGNATRIFTAARHPKSFVSLDSADHLLSRREDASYAAAVLAAWATRYLPSVEADEASGAEPALAHNQVVVRERGDGKYTQDVFAGPHRLVADEPTELGGLDRGPGPYEFLLAALGSCTSMTLRMYANHKQLPLGRVSVHLTHEKIHAKDCAECETRTGMLDRIERTITLEGDLTEEQRERLLQIADRCPVHRTLHSEVVEISRLAPAPGAADEA